MRITLMFFAGAAEAAGYRQLEMVVPEGATVEYLAGELRQRFSPLVPLLDVGLWAVNEEYVAKEAPLRDGDRVALIPPVSGGTDAPLPAAPPTTHAPMAAVSSAGADGRLVTAPISVDAVLGRVLRPEAGAVVLFLGTVRSVTGEQWTAAMEYEAYAPMAEKEMAAVARKAVERWPGVRLAINHRLGHLNVGEISVAVAASAPHRPEAFRACRWAIDRLKAVVPIWKREIGPDGAAEWVHWHCCHDHEEAGDHE